MPFPKKLPLVVQIEVFDDGEHKTIVTQGYWRDGDKPLTVATPDGDAVVIAHPPQVVAALMLALDTFKRNVDLEAPDVQPAPRVLAATVDIQTEMRRRNLAGG